VAAPVGRTEVPAQTAAVAAAAPAPPAPGGPGPVADPAGTAAPPPNWRARQHRPRGRLRIGQHAAPAAALDRLQLTSVSSGLLLGRGQDGSPVAVALFRPEPVLVVLIGGAWVVRLVGFRALAFGARVVVHTHDATGWVDLGRQATGRTDRVAVRAPGSPVSMAGSVDTPLLRLTGAGRSAGAAGPTGPAHPPWTTELSVWPALPALPADQAGQLVHADLVLAQRLSPDEAATLVRLRGLPERAWHALQMLPDETLAVASRTGLRYAWAGPTDLERETLGPPGRH
jgi:hypothetical protein